MKEPWLSDRRHRHPDDATSALEKWVRENGGPSAVAKIIDVDRVTVGSWLARKCTPSLEVAVRLINAAKGVLTAENILESTRAW